MKYVKINYVMSVSFHLKNFIVYVFIGLISKFIFENEISFFIATALNSLDDNPSSVKLISNIIVINLLIFIYYL